MDWQELAGLGLSRNESKVYLSLCRLGPSTASVVAKDCGLHRVLVYDVLGRLAEKGLTGEIFKDGHKVFQPASPAHLQDWLDLQEKELGHKRAVLKQAYPHLLQMQALASEGETVSFFKGKQGIRSAIEKMLATNKPVYTIGSSGKTRELLGPVFKRVRDHFEKKHVPVKMLYYESARRKKDIGFKNAKLRFLPDEYRNPMLIDITYNITIILMLGDNPIAIVVESKAMADSFMKYFEYLWKIARN
jgi:sugar-specific transcriptional regulator TrmB